MLRGTVHRISAVLLILALVFGPAVNGVYAASMGAKMAAAASDMNSSGQCSDCGSAKGDMPVGVCSAASYCSSFAFFPAAGRAAFDRVSADPLAPDDARRLAERVSPPDPYPPRSTILS